MKCAVSILVSLLLVDLSEELPKFVNCSLELDVLKPYARNCEEVTCNDGVPSVTKRCTDVQACPPGSYIIGCAYTSGEGIFPHCCHQSMCGTTPVAPENTMLIEHDHHPPTDDEIGPFYDTPSSEANETPK